MAATETQPAPALRPSRTGVRARLGDPAPAALGLALLTAVAYAAFANGAAGLPEESRVQVWIALVSLVAVAALAFGRGLRLSVRSPAGLGVALLAAFAAWCAISIAWSIAPDQSWVEANRAFSYALVVGLGFVLGSSLPRAAERAAVGFLALATLVALYALGGKLAPWLEIPGILDLNHTQMSARLREPFGYWNALALFCGMAAPLALGAAADRERVDRGRLVALLALVLLVLTTVMAYSRGGVIVLVAALAVQVLMSGDRKRLLALVGVALAASVPPLVVGLTLNDLTDDGLSESARADGGLLLLLALVIGAAIAVLLAKRVLRAEERLAPSGRGRKLTRRSALVACGVALLVLVGGAAASEGGLAGELKRQVGDVTERRFDPQEDPSRLLRTNSGNRWDWWGEALGAAWDRPLAGHGAGSFPLLHQLYRDDFLNVLQPHSVPLEFLAETGIVGAALGLGGILLLGLAAVSNGPARRDSRQRGYAVALIAAGAAWGLHLFVDWDWDIPGVTMPALALLAVAAARPREERGEATPRRARPSLSAGRGAHAVGVLVASLVLCLALASSLLPAISRNLTTDAFVATATGTPADLREAAADAARAKRLNPLSIDPLRAEAAIALRTGEPQRAGTLLLEAVERAPDRPEAWVELAALQLFSVGDRAGALRSLNRALRLDPFNFSLLFGFGVAVLDERSSASATGTPLPERVPTVPQPPGAAPVAPGAAPQQPAAPPAQPQAPAGPTAQPPAPAPQAPAPQPEPPAQEEPFRSEG